MIARLPVLPIVVTMCVFRTRLCHLAELFILFGSTVFPVTQTLATQITERDKQLAREVWSLVAKDYAAVGNFLFRELFTAYPDYIKYFERMKATPDQDIFESARFKRHMVSALFPSIALLLQNLDYPEKLEEQLQEIGANHKRRDLHREQFQALKKIIILTFKKALPEQFTTEVEAAWTKILSVAFAKIEKHL